ncbi:MAG: chorismate pyruvate-lyase family protein [Chromatiales bacterium]|jgi:chorismate-pyruvate lyase
MEMLERYYKKNTEASIKQPFRCEGYVQGGVLTNDQQEDILMEKVPPFLRTLIVTDGTVTKTLEAYYWEPVSVDVLEQGLTQAKLPIPWLEVEQGEDVLIRKVHLRGVNSGKIYTSAMSVIRPSVIPLEQRKRLLDRSIGIGALIRDTGLESYRELLEVGLEHSLAYMHIDDIAKPKFLDLVYRTYRIFMGGKPALLITETFPWNLYK